MNRPFDTIHEDDTSDILTLAATVIDKSGVAADLQARYNQRNPTGVGAPPTLPQLTVRAFLIVLFHLAYACKPITWPNITRHLHITYTDEQLAILGLTDLRNPERTTRIRANHKASDAEIERIRSWATDILAPIDNTPIAVTGRVSNNTLAAAYTAGGEPLKAKGRALLAATNNIVAATIDPTNLTGYQGHLAVDEHQAAIAALTDDTDLTQKTNPPTDDIFNGLHPNDPTNEEKQLLHAANTMSGVSVHLRRIREGSAIGVTAAIAVAAPHQTPIAPITLGIGFDTPSAASIPAGLDAIDAAINTGHIPPQTGNKHRYVITDQAYNHRNGWHEGLIKRRLDQLIRYPKNYVTVHDLWRPGDTDGPRLVSGRIVCPGVPGPVARNINLRPLPNKTTPTRLHKRDRDLNTLKGAIMPTQGRPKPASNRPPGRPRNDSKNEPANPADQTWNQTVICPARAGLYRCALYPPSLKLDPKTTPTAAPPKTPPTCCQGTYHNVTLNHLQFKQLQHLQAGSWEHDDFFRHARAHNEAFFSHLTRRNGGNLTDRTIVFRRNAITALTIAMCISATNLKLQAAWQHRLTLNGGSPKTPQRRLIATNRQRILTRTN